MSNEEDFFVIFMMKSKKIRHKDNMMTIVRQLVYAKYTSKPSTYINH